MILLIAVFYYIIFATIWTAFFLVIATRIYCKTSINILTAFGKSLLIQFLSVLGIILFVIFVELDQYLNRVEIDLMLYLVLVFLFSVFLYKNIRLPFESEKLGWAKSVAVACIQYALVYCCFVVWLCLVSLLPRS